jgi:hypothetical protein
LKENLLSISVLSTVKVKVKVKVKLRDFRYEIFAVLGCCTALIGSLVTKCQSTLFKGKVILIHAMKAYKGRRGTA